MIFWESGTFYALILGSAIVILWLYAREEKRSKSVQAFFASVTHELRTPLTSIRLQAESIADGESDPQLVRRLLEDTQRLESQVERTLELARVEGGGPLFLHSLSLRPCIERAILPWVEHQSDRLSIQLEILDLNILADSSAVQVIFRNLLENSVKHSRKNKVNVVLRAERSGKEVAIHFSDDGQGASDRAAHLGSLFEKGADSQGAGVGLYLIRVLMERMRGKAEFHTMQEGFAVTLRFVEPVAVSARQAEGYRSGEPAHGA